MALHQDQAIEGYITLGIISQFFAIAQIALVIAIGIQVFKLFGGGAGNGGGGGLGGLGRFIRNPFSGMGGGSHDGGGHGGGGHGGGSHDKAERDAKDIDENVQKSERERQTVDSLIQKESALLSKAGNLVEHEIKDEAACDKSLTEAENFVDYLLRLEAELNQIHQSHGDSAEVLRRIQQIRENYQAHLDRLHQIVINAKKYLFDVRKDEREVAKDLVAIIDYDKDIEKAADYILQHLSHDADKLEKTINDWNLLTHDQRQEWLGIFKPIHKEALEIKNFATTQMQEIKSDASRIRQEDAELNQTIINLGTIESIIRNLSHANNREDSLQKLKIQISSLKHYLRKSYNTIARHRQSIAQWKQYDQRIDVLSKEFEHHMSTLRGLKATDPNNRLIRKRQNELPPGK